MAHLFMVNYARAKSITRVIFGISLFIHNFIILQIAQFKITQDVLNQLNSNQKLLLSTYGFYNFIGRVIFFMAIFELMRAIVKEKGIARKYSFYLGYYGIIYMILHVAVLKIVGL